MRESCKQTTDIVSCQHSALCGTVFILNVCTSGQNEELLLLTFSLNFTIKRASQAHDGKEHKCILDFPTMPHTMGNGYYHHDTTDRCTATAVVLRKFAPPPQSSSVNLVTIRLPSCTSPLLMMMMIQSTIGMVHVCCTPLCYAWRSNARDRALFIN